VFSRPSSIPIVWNQSAAVADLDGDGRPDLAIVKAEVWESNGSQYLIELDLTSRSAPSFFNVFAPRDGLDIVPYDIDGDRDLDLLITSVWTGASAGVWINDGHGGFTPGDPTASPRFIWTQEPGIRSDPYRDASQAIVCKSYQSATAFSAPPYIHDEKFPEHRIFVAGAGLPTIAVAQPQTRAPPSSPAAISI